MRTRPVLSLEEQVRQNVCRFADGELSLEQFQTWFVPMSWNIERSHDSSLIAIVYEIDGLLAESSSARWDESQLRDKLVGTILPFIRRS